MHEDIASEGGTCLLACTAFADVALCQSLRSTIRCGPLPELEITQQTTHIFHARHNAGVTRSVASCT